MAILLRARASLPVLLLVAAIGSILQNRMYAPPQEEDQRRKAPDPAKVWPLPDSSCLTL